MRRFVCTLALIGLSGTICAGPEPSMKEATLAKFNSADEMLAYLGEQATREPDLRMGLFADDSVGSPVPSATNGLGSGSEFSTTNIQEAGVDESDVVKNDGAYIYLLKNNSLRIIQAVPADALAQVGQVDLGGWGSTMYLAGDRVVVLAGLSGVEGTIVSLIDVTDRTNPAVQQTWQFEGRLAASRLIGDHLHVVMMKTPSITRDSTGTVVPWDTLDPLLPGYTITVGGETTRQGKLVDWSHCYHPADGQGYELTVVTTVDLAAPDAEPQSSGITAAAGVVYASPTSLYITSSQSGWWFDQRADDSTTVHKFDLTGDRAIYIGGGEVPGHLLNQYSLGEQNGYLRVGSTVGSLSRTGNSAAINAVYVLDSEATDGRLDIVGQIEDIAPGESIYSARFVGDRGFLVTFKKVDPLYTLDLSDPQNPQLIGQLKVPGYSDYIHPLDADHLLTIGKDAYDMGGFAWYQGVQLSIFDVSDFADPKLLAKEIIGVRGTESAANTNPKAFNYFGPLEALAIPIRLAEGPTQSPSQNGQFTFGGLYVYHVSVADGFGLLGRISTSTNPSPYSSNASSTRGIFIGDVVYAVTSNVVVAASAADPTQIQPSLTVP